MKKKSFTQQSNSQSNSKTQHSSKKFKSKSNYSSKSSNFNKSMNQKKTLMYKKSNNGNNNSRNNSNMSGKGMNLELLSNYKRILIKSENLLELQKKLQNDQYLRFNSNSSEEEKELFDFFTKKLRVKLERTYLPLCYKINKSFFSLSGTLPLLSGKAYLQDISSQLPLNCFDFSIFENKSIEILDMCSSPGSKTSQLQFFLKKYNIDAKIYANEMQENRIKRLVNNIQKSQLKNVEFLHYNALDLNFKDKFDLILLDAPCSGNLILEKNWLQKRNKKGILENSVLQKKLLTKAKEMCKKGGYISYSTCSMEKEENEENVLFSVNKLQLKSVIFLDKFSWKFPYEYRSTQIVKSLQDKDKNALKNSFRIHPPLSNSQGFFITIFQK